MCYHLCVSIILLFLCMILAKKAISRNRKLSGLWGKKGVGFVKGRKKIYLEIKQRRDNINIIRQILEDCFGINQTSLEEVFMIIFFLVFRPLQLILFQATSSIRPKIKCNSSQIMLKNKKIDIKKMHKRT